MNIPDNLKGNDLLKFLVENKEDIMYAKKSIVKEADSIMVSSTPLSKSIANKSFDKDATEIKVRAIINTTNVIDSHKDVHINGIWNKSVSENNNIKFLQEHQMRFDKVIADKTDLSVSVKSMSWKSLGFDMSGNTEALTFDANIKESRNKFMFDSYKNKDVDNHSVGMRYMKLDLAINSDDEDFQEEKAVWDKHYPSIANKEEMGKQKYFWAVTEAKVIEGSAVVLGSNSFTPTLSNKEETKLTQKEIKINAIRKWLAE